MPYHFSISSNLWPLAGSSHLQTICRRPNLCLSQTPPNPKEVVIFHIKPGSFPAHFQNDSEPSGRTLEYVGFLESKQLETQRLQTCLIFKSLCSQDKCPGPHLPIILSSVQFSSVAQLCLILCDPMDCSTPGLPVYHQLLEFTQTHVHWVGDAIQSSHPLSSPSLPPFNLSQHQGLFQWVSSLN